LGILCDLQDAPENYARRLKGLAGQFCGIGSLLGIRHGVSRRG
jgi:hypothetical protein